MTQTHGFEVWARKNGGQWVHTGTFAVRKTATAVQMATNRNGWTAEIRPVKPAPTPVPLPTDGNPSAYSVMSARVIVGFYPTGKVKRGKDGKEKQELGIIIHDKVMVKCLRSGQKWQYTGHYHGWTDSRIKTGTVELVKNKGSIPHDKFPKELGRMVGEKTVAVLAGLLGDPISRSEWEEMVKAF